VLLAQVYLVNVKHEPMYLDIVLIDYLDLDGVLTTYRITPLEGHDSVVIDRLRDIDVSFDSPDSINVGGARVYNSSTCSIQIQKTRINRFRSDNQGQVNAFGFEHMGIPLGRRSHAHAGYYNLVLPPGHRFTELHIVDPYDEQNRETIRKKHFRYDVLWDTSCNTSLASMMLSSGRGSFSFILIGQSKVFKPGSDSEFLASRESTRAVSGLLDHHIISPKARKAIAEDIASKSEWLELKPNIAGIGINLNAIIRDSINAFQKRIKREDVA
jgi:hypothetical protein